MSDDIVERLGQDNDYLWFIGDDGYPGLRVMSETERRQEAADEIKRLRAEHDNLRVLLRGRTAEFQAEVERLWVEHEVARLKDAQEHWLALAEVKRLRSEVAVLRDESRLAGEEVRRG